MRPTEKSSKRQAKRQIKRQVNRPKGLSPRKSCRRQTAGWQAAREALQPQRKQ